ncbi:MAG: hypothetical protein M1504_03635 [Candidatus Marsarchaeota archaeon]|nr:hypothetical protein [Candidatus Marsarchaeota archaeon]
MANAKLIAPIAIVIIALVLIAVVFVGGGFGAKSTSTQPSANTSTTNIIQSANKSTSGILFASTPYYQYSYLISSAPLSSSARTALGAYNVSITSLANGSTEVDLIYPGNTGNMTFMVPTGYKLYYIEKSGSDDTSPGYDYYPTDDGYALVNSTGYVVRNATDQFIPAKST